MVEFPRLFAGGPAELIAFAPWRPSDRNAVVAFVSDILVGEFGFPVLPDEFQDLEDAVAAYDGGGFWCAWAGNSLVGTLGLMPFGTSYGMLRRMFVARDWRGRQHGIALGLLQALIDCARGRHIDSIFLGTTAEFPAAHAFYEKNGFVEVAKKALPSSFPWQPSDDVFFRLRLSQEGGE